MIAEHGAEKLGKARGLVDPRDKPVPLRLGERGEVKRREGGVKFVQVTLPPLPRPLPPVKTSSWFSLSSPSSLPSCSSLSSLSLTRPPTHPTRTAKSTAPSQLDGITSKGTQSSGFSRGRAGETLPMASPIRRLAVQSGLQVSQA